MKDRLLFIDTETGGLHPNEHSLLSLAMVVWEDMEIIDTKELFINDGRYSVTEEALSINKIDLSKHNESALLPPQAIEEIFQFIHRHFPQGKSITLAGHNVQFDINFLRFFLSRNEVDFSKFFSHRSIDTSSILYYLYLSGKIKHRAISSDQAFDHFKIKVKGRHTAEGDAIATAILFTKLLQLSA